MKYFYITIDRLNGRHQLMLLAEKLLTKGFDDRVEYHEGGWSDGMIRNTAPHLRFESEDDAIAYVLAYGGTYSTKIPEAVSPDYSI